MSRRPTMPSVSWSTGTVKKEEEVKEEEEKEENKEEKKKESVHATIEDYHAFKLNLDAVQKPEEKKEVIPEANRHRSGMSLAEYRKRYGSSVC